LWRAAILPAALVSAVLASPASSRPVDDVPARCFGAAARDATNVACRFRPAPVSVLPAPAEAKRLPNSPCREQRGEAGPPVCAFGAPAAGAAQTVALVGDSHAGHWRAALAFVAERNGWHGLSLTHSSCPLQKALRDLKEPRRTSCRNWKRQVFAWFERHPEVRTVFVAGLTGGSGVVAEDGLSAFTTSRRGYERAWRALPATVETIVVVRDTPKFHVRTNRCVQRAVDRGREPGKACARPRREALDDDPAIAAARRLGSPRVKTVDLTRYFCDPRRCFPVVGGALVLRDNTHVTGTFSATLGPYLRRALDAVRAPARAR
jgi:hypothetical protein